MTILWARDSNCNLYPYIIYIFMYIKTAAVSQFRRTISFFIRCPSYYLESRYKDGPQIYQT